LENSPLDRIQQQIQVGNDWTNKPVKFDYEANADGDVKKYVATFNYSTFESGITLSGTYGGGHSCIKTPLPMKMAIKPLNLKTAEARFY
jgi:hypothetical protein